MGSWNRSVTRSTWIRGGVAPTKEARRGHGFTGAAVAAGGGVPCDNWQWRGAHADGVGVGVASEAPERARRHGGRGPAGGRRASRVSCGREVADGDCVAVGDSETDGVPRRARDVLLPGGSGGRTSCLEAAVGGPRPGRLAAGDAEDDAPRSLGPRGLDGDDQVVRDDRAGGRRPRRARRGGGATSPKAGGRRPAGARQRAGGPCSAQLRKAARSAAFPPSRGVGGYSDREGTITESPRPSADSREITQRLHGLSPARAMPAIRQP